MRGVAIAAAIFLLLLAGCSKSEKPCPTCGNARAAVHPKPVAPQAPVRVGPGITPPILIQRVEPQLPDRLKHGFQPFVSFEATIDASGNVTAVRWVGPNDQTVLPYVLDAVKRWKFRPASRDGEPIAVLYDISFTLPGR